MQKHHDFQKAFSVVQITDERMSVSEIDYMSICQLSANRKKNELRPMNITVLLQFRVLKKK